ncbi:MAG: cell division protein FtsW [Fibrobacteria bacterium]|nr:cell division protein FtsW [Fibrobacteria bacterium]
MTQRNQPDWILLAACVVLAIIGTAMIYSASSGYGAIRWSWGSGRVLGDHLLRLGVGTVAGVVAFLVPPKWLRASARPLFLVAASLLVFTIASQSVGSVNGAKRWISLAMFSLQPSELAKLALVLSLAWYLSRPDTRIQELSGLVPALWRVALMCGLIILQPNFSTASALLATSFAILLVAGMSWKHIGSLVAIGFVGMLGIMVLQPYRMARVEAFLHPEAHAQGSALQSLQSLIALGNGGVLGVGLGRGTAKLLHLPEPYTDTIFAVLGEEMGLLGTLAVMGLFALVAWRGLAVARTSADPFLRLLAAGLTTSICLWAALHAMVCVRMIPTTGLPMPFVSYGGSSLTFSMVSLGLLLNLSRHTTLLLDEPPPPRSAWSPDRTSSRTASRGRDVSTAIGRPAWR